MLSRAQLARIWDGLKELGRELLRPESIAILAVTLLLVTRYYLGYSRSGQRLLGGIWAWAAGAAPLLGHPVWQKQVLAVVLQLAVPILLIWLLHRKRLRDFGLGLGDWRLWLPIAALIFIVQVVVVAFFLSKDPAYLGRYPSFAPARAGGGLFWAWEASRLFYMLSWEFLFRGYLLFALEKRFGYAALAIQTLPFVMWHIVGAKPISEIYFTVASGLLSGLFVLLCRSVWPVVLLHAFGAILLDIFIVFGR
ncbi:MAG: type II CAAX endopeptidase family protein [Polyangia bacterium]|jgi:membrane protease YdiL (CAAX protease family)|nr:type II CAAX endopeptidase family protein [Polyangia bacterium]